MINFLSYLLLIPKLDKYSNNSRSNKCLTFNNIYYTN